MFSTAIKKKPIRFGEVMIIQSLFAKPEYVKEIHDNIGKSNPQFSEEEVKKRAHQHIMNDNFFNHVMDYVLSFYELNLNEQEIENEKKAIMNNSGISEQEALNTAKTTIMKELIFNDLIKDWEIEITDKQVTHYLESFYRDTGEPIREFLNDKEKFNTIRKSLLHRTMVDRLLNAFVPKFQLPTPTEKKEETEK